MVENRSLDAEFGVGLEFAVFFRIVLVDGVHEADDPSALEVVEVDMGREAHRDPVHDVADQGSVFEDDLLFDGGREFIVFFLGFAKDGFHAHHLLGSFLSS